MLQNLSKEELYNKIYGGWLGKNIGGTLGAPLEGQMKLMDLTFYSKLPDGPLENDDLDLQLVWLHALEQYGARLTAQELGQEWKDHIFFPFDEYGYALANLRRGLIPPVSGSFNNPFADCMGSPIRSEIWAMVTAGLPNVAAYYAYQDAIVDHAGGEGVYGEVFFAAIQSAAFFEQDRERLIELGLSYLPASSRTAQAVQDLLKWHAQGVSWIEARELILVHHGHPNFTDAPQNIAFTMLGWLYGEDFGDAILKAVNCGYDTDCTGATLGAILGIIGGKDNIPEKWVAPVGDRVIVSPPINGFPAPANLDELTIRTIRMGQEVRAVWGANPPYDASQIRELIASSATSNTYLLPQRTSNPSGLKLTIDYGNSGPAIGLNEKKSLQVHLRNDSSTTWEGFVELDVPAGWQTSKPILLQLAPNETHKWTAQLTSDGTARSAHPCHLRLARLHDDSPWSAESIPFSLVGASHWSLTAPGETNTLSISASGNRIPFNEQLQTYQAGVYRAVTKIYNPRAREVQLIVATAQPLQVHLNGKQIISDDEFAPYMPAFHRAPVQRRAEIHLPAGEAIIELEIHKPDQTAEALEVYVLPVSTRQTKQPGTCYYFTDILFLPINKS